MAQWHWNVFVLPVLTPSLQRLYRASLDPTVKPLRERETALSDLERRAYFTFYVAA